METGLLIVRVVVGLTLAAHGAQKLFGLFGGYGLAGTGGFFESLGFRPGRLFALMSGLAEGAGGLLLALGLFTPFTSAVIISNFIVAIVSAHLDKGFFGQNGGYEFPLLLAATAAGLGFTGPGSFSLDGLLGLPLVGQTWGLVAIGLGVLGALPPLVVRSAVLRRRASVVPEGGSHVNV